MRELIKRKIIKTIKQTNACKSTVHKKIAALFWKGHLSSNFVIMSQEISKVIEEMIQSNDIKYTPRQPLKLCNNIGNRTILFSNKDIQ
jgi:hypothetical protein